MMGRWKVGLASAAVLMGAACAVAGQAAGQAVDLGDAARSALATHPRVAGASSRAEAARSTVAEARSSWWPSVGAVALATRYEEPMVVAPLHGFDPANLPVFDRTLVQGHASLDYVVFDGGARAARVRTASALAGAASATAAAAADEVLVEVTSAYLEALSARDVLRAHRELASALERERGRSSLLFEQGRAARVHVLRTEAALSRARAELEGSTERVRVALHRLARTAGLPAAVRSESLAGVRVPEEALERESLMDAALESSPELARAESRAAAARAQLGAARSAFLPRLSLSGRYSVYGSGETDPAPEWNAGVQLTYPLFTGGARGEGVERAESEFAAARADVELAARGVADAVDGALGAYRAALARSRALEAAVSQSAEVARIEALALETGAGVQTDYLRAEADLLQARAGLVEARHAVVEARVRLARVTGSLTLDWLESRIVEAQP